MGQYLNPGNEGFAKSINSGIYVDKSEMLRVTNGLLDTEQCMMCVSRPRRFGKSMAARMLAAYYSKGCDSRELFSPYAIARGEEAQTHFEEHLNRYDVIKWDMTEFIGKCKNSAGRLPLDSIVSLIQSEVSAELTAAYPGCVRDGDITLADVLARINLEFGNRFIIIIDEWDALFREDKDNTKLQEAYITLLRSLFKDDRTTRFIKLAYITGIFPVKKYGTQSAMNNFDEYSMLYAGELAPFVGFTEDEVQALADRFNMDMEEVRQWYDGYLIGGVGKDVNYHVFNPRSIVCCMRNRRVNSYWTDTETYESIKGYITANFDGLKDAIVAMLGGEKYEVDVRTFQNDLINIRTRDQVLTLLIHLGYLAYDMDERVAYIPNYEIRMEFEAAVRDSGWTAVTEALEQSEDLLLATWDMDCKTVAKMVEDAHEDAASTIRRNDENSLACAITLAYYSAQNYYSVFRELPRGRGFADIVYLPKKGIDRPALVVELKWNKDVSTAIKQIKDRRYTRHLEDFSGEILLVGISYIKGECGYECEIEKIVK